MRNSNFKYYKFLRPKTSEKRESNETDANRDLLYRIYPAMSHRDSNIKGKKMRVILSTHTPRCWSVRAIYKF